MSRDFVHIHASGYHHGDADTFREDLLRYKNENHVSILTGTECEYEYKKEIVREVFEDFGKFAGSITYSDDTFIVWDKSQWKEVFREAQKVTNIRWTNTEGKLRDPQYAKIVVLEHVQTKLRMLVSVIHAPSSVQEGNGFKKNSVRVAAWIDGTRNWKKRRNKLYRQYKCQAMLISADWNVDFKKPLLRAAVKAVQPRMSFTLKVDDIPRAGTHGGGRLIDFSMIRGLLRVRKSPMILPKTKASDHAAYIEHLRLM